MTNVIKKLNVYLADLNVMYRKVQNYHWNVDGRNFFTIHAKLEEYYDEINENIDSIAERNFIYQRQTIRNNEKYLEITNIKEANDEEITDLDLVKIVKQILKLF